MTNKTNQKKIVRIGGASGFWGDSRLGPIQLVQSGQIDYLVFDYLAELTMSILAGAKLKNPDAGYATDFVNVAMRDVLPQVVEQGIRVVSNAGGMNPVSCARALLALAEEMALRVRIAVVMGDDVMHLLPDLREEGKVDMFGGAELPQRVVSANAYLGAVPIAWALDQGAQIVITGRCVDTAVTLGVLMHEFGWAADDYDRLAAGSLAGHIIECGCQGTGGLHTDWDQVPDWANMGYPIVECESDGTFNVTKPANTGGLVNVATTAEQLLYEIGDPASYLLPDVTCDFRHVCITQTGTDRVIVTGARGRAPTPFYKVCATAMSGFRVSAQLTIIGEDAVRKAQRTGEALLERGRGLCREFGKPDFTQTHIDLIGAESAYGPHGQAMKAREVTLRLTVTHPDKLLLEAFSREFAAPGTSWSPGTTGSGGGRPSVSPVICQCSFLLEKHRVQMQVLLDGHAIGIPAPDTPAIGEASPLPPIDLPLDSGADRIAVPLIRMAYGRSGDKGDISNIGLIARKPEWFPVLREQVTPERVAAYLAHLVKGEVRRYDLPGIHAVNLVCESALGGGGMASLRNDPLGKGMAQILLSMPIHVPGHLLTA